MLSGVDVSVFLATTQPEVCIEYYTQALGLVLREDNQYALVFDLKGVELRISKVPSFTPMPFTVLDWQISDMTETHGMLTEKGVVFVHYNGMGMDERNVWTTPDGTQIAWFKDPDGNTLSISQRSV